MKKSFLMLTISFLLLVFLIFWWFWQDVNLQPMHIIITLAVLIMVLTFIFEGIRNIHESKQELAIDDELSKRSQHKAGYHSYLLSVYIWVALYFLKDLFSQMDYILATGIFCMALTFILTRFIYRKRGSV